MWTFVNSCVSVFFGEHIPGDEHIRLNPVHHKELAIAGQYQPGRMRDWILMLFIGLPLIQSRATISDNGYKGVVIAISPEEAEDLVLVESLKELFTSASRELYGATRQRAFFKEVTILVPQGWSIEAEPSVDETFEDAEFRVGPS